MWRVSIVESVVIKNGAGQHTLTNVFWARSGTAIRVDEEEPLHSITIEVSFQVGTNQPSDNTIS